MLLLKRNYITVKQDHVKQLKLLKRTLGVSSGREKIPKNVTIINASDDSKLFLNSKNYTESIKINFNLGERKENC